MPNTTEPFDNMSCTGAEIPDVRANQLTALNKETDLVTISIGGNDFIGVMRSCLLPVSCASSMREKYALLPGIEVNLTALYGEVKTRAPNALVVVVGYPHMISSRPDLVGAAIACLTRLFELVYILPL
jgi:lysophospholipase L1-like esterase